MEQSDVAKRLRSAARREHPADVQKAVDRLRGAADARPELKSVVDVCLSVVEAARREADEASMRAEIAEEAMAAVTPHMEELVERTESAERSILRRSEIDAAREMQVQKAEQHARDWEITPRAAETIRKMAAQFEDLRLAQTAQAAGVAKAVQIIKCVHLAVKNEDGRSPVQCFEEHGHVWSVTDADGSLIAEVEKRSDAVQLVADLLAEELAELDAQKSAAGEWTEDERYRPHVRDEVHPATPWRDRRKNPEPVERPPAPPGEIAPGVSKRKSKKQARIL